MLALEDQPAEIGNDLQIEDADVGGAGDALMILDAEVTEEEDQSDSGDDAPPPVTPPSEPSPVPREESPSRDSPPPPPRYPDDGIDRDLTISSTWGCFRITPKRNAKFGGFQVACRFHKLNFKTGCKRWFPLQGNTEADMNNTTRRMKFWSNAAPGFDRQRKHMRFPALFADAPPDALLEATQVTEAPGHISNDVELDQLDGRSPGGESAESDTSSSSSSSD